MTACSFSVVSEGGKASATHPGLDVLSLLVIPGIGLGCCTFNIGECTTPSGMVADKQHCIQLLT